METVHDLNAVGDYYVPLEHVCDGYQEQWDNCPGGESFSMLFPMSLLVRDLEKCGPCQSRPQDIWGRPLCSA